MSESEVYKEQWLACAKVLRRQAKELEDLAKITPSRADYIEDSKQGLVAAQDDILIAIEDGKRITKAMLKKLPPWRARMLANVAQRAGVPMEVTAEHVLEEARRVGGQGTLWQ